MTDQAPELREKMHNAVCKILTGNEICTDAGDWLCPQDVDSVNEMCADIVVAVLALTRPPSERPGAQVREALGTLLQKYRPIAKQSWPVAGGRLCRTQRKINDARQIVVILEGAIATLTAERPEAVRENLTAEEFAQVLPRPEAAVAWECPYDTLDAGSNKRVCYLTVTTGEFCVCKCREAAIPHEEPGRETMTSVPGDDGGL